ncbi:MAG: hypothetical protein WBW27_07875 [Pseudolabrys sp.]
MIDALEAERSASKKKVVRVDAADFACDAPAEQPQRKPRRRTPRPSDESAP